MTLKVPPPRPEPIAHLAVLRNPKHPEWKSNPERYLSPTLCNASQAYVQRFVEHPTRDWVMKGRSVPSSWSEFTLGNSHVKEFQREEKKAEKYRLKRKSRQLELEALKRRVEEQLALSVRLENPLMTNHRSPSSSRNAIGGQENPLRNPNSSAPLVLPLRPRSEPSGVNPLEAVQLNPSAPLVLPLRLRSELGGVNPCSDYKSDNYSVMNV